MSQQQERDREKKEGLSLASNLGCRPSCWEGTVLRPWGQLLSLCSTQEHGEKDAASLLLSPFHSFLGQQLMRWGHLKLFGPFLLRPVFLETLLYQAQVCVHVTLNPVKLTLKTSH